MYLTLLLLTILFYRASSFFLIIDLYFFYFCSYYTHTFNPTAKLVIPVGLPTNEANAEIETQPLTSEMKMLDII